MELVLFVVAVSDCYGVGLGLALFLRFFPFSFSLQVDLEVFDANDDEEKILDHRRQGRRQGGRGHGPPLMLV